MSNTRTQHLNSLRDKLKSMSSSNKGFNNPTQDETFWKPEVSKDGNGSAVIRYLPTKDGEETPVVQLWSHSFQGPTGQYYIELCPTSIGLDCPACAANKELWKAGEKTPERELASKRKRKLNYISNIEVLNDPKHPEKNGKVFRYKYPKTIFDMIQDQISPPEEFADMVPVDPFDLDEGAYFRLRIVKKDGFQNYDKSTFDTPSAIGDEDRKAEIMASLHSLNEVLNPKNFKSFEDLKKRFDKVVGEDGPVAESRPKATPRPAAPAPAATTPKPQASPTRTPSPEPPPAEDAGDDWLDRLAQPE